MATDICPPADGHTTDVRALARHTSLFDLDQTLCALMEAASEAAEENNGDIPPELQQALLDYFQAFGEKVDSIAQYIHHVKRQAAAAGLEIERLSKRKGAAETRVERLKNLLESYMIAHNIRKMEGRLNTISLRKNSQDSLNILETEKIPLEYWRVSITLNAVEWDELLTRFPEEDPMRIRFERIEAKREPDNGKVRAALQSGVEIEGARLIRGEHIRLA